jgi:hypothetical protein
MTSAAWAQFGEGEAIAQFRDASNPAGESRQQTLLSIDKFLDFRMDYKLNHAAAAAGAPGAPEVPATGAPGAPEVPAAAGAPKAPEANLWFRHFTPFVEYGYDSNRDRRLNGLDSNLHAGTVGMTFQTVYDVVVGAMFNHTYASGNGAGHTNTTMDSNNATFFFAKNWDLLYAGTTLTFGGADLRMRVPGMRTTTDIDSFAVTPYIGIAGYEKGPFSFYTTLSCIFRFQDYDYSAPIPSDTSRDATLVLMNRFNYALNEKCVLTGIFDWNKVVGNHPVDLPHGDIDSCWFTLGAKFRYRLTEKVELYTGYCAQVGNQAFEDHQVNVGMSVAF